MLLKNYRISLYEYFWGMMFVILCGFTASGVIPAKTYMLLFLGLIHYVSYPQKYKGSLKPLFILVASFVSIFVIHYLYYKYLDKAFLDKIILLTCGFLTIKQLGGKFRYVYMKVMFYLAALSLICYILQCIHIIPDIPFLYSSNRVKYYGIFFWNVRYSEMYNSITNGFPRNCGPFWEPGAFSGYLLMVALLYFNDLDLLWKKYRKECIILGLAFITTFSTQGYVASFILAISLFITKSRKKNFVKISFAFLIFVYIVFITYETSPFLKEKINSQIETSENWDVQVQNDRFSTTLLDIDNIKRHPVIGCSSNIGLLYTKHPEVITYIERVGNLGSGTGMTGFMAQRGVPLFLIWLLLSFLSLQRYYNSKKNGALICLFILALGQGEAYLNQIFYLSIPFLYQCTPPKKGK